MGKMTKHKCDWKPTQLEAAIAAKELHAHTATILGNPRQFEPRYDLDRMTLREAVRTSMEVYKCCYRANEINAKDNPMLARRRLALQVEAIVSAKWLQALQDVIHGQFHVDADKFWNWAEMTENTLKKIKAWHEGDKKRYGETALATAGMLDAARAFLSSTEIATGYTAWEALTDCDYIEEGFGGADAWNALLDGAAVALGKTRAEIDEFLANIPTE